MFRETIGVLRAAWRLWNEIRKGAVPQPMPHLRAEVTQRNALGAVTVAKLIDKDIALFCRRIDFAEWEPLYAIRDGVIVEMPSCFNLNHESIKALEVAASAKEKN